MSDEPLLPDLIPAERPTHDDQWHHVEIDCESWSGFQRFICTAPVGAPCRSLPSCQHSGGRCEDYEGEHAHARTDRTLVDTGECVIGEWINNSEETGRGLARIPVATEWEGDFWIWKARGEAKP
jgi:hypothetical protein